MLYIRCMIRTQIYLPEDMHMDIKMKAAKTKKSQAVIIREAIKKGLKPRRTSKTLGEELLELAKLGGRGPKDLSTNLDAYLYGDKK